jgi:hypothetical protein
MSIRVALLVLAAAAALNAQDWYPKNNFTIGGGFARPRGDVGVFLSDAPGVNISYGRRFHRNFQADFGFDTAFGAANVNDYLETGLGYRRIRDYQYFVPFGGRAILPLAGDRFQIAGGMGGVFMRYAERISQPSDFYRIDCPVCSSRSGWGYYGLVNVGGFVDQRRIFRVGVTAKMYRGNTDGEPLGNIPPLRTTDRWLMIGGEFGISF